MSAAPTRRLRRRERGFTFLEILVVMGVMAILMGIGVGYLQSIGSASRADQARVVVRETLYACKQSSNGGTRARFELRLAPDSNPESGRLVVGASVARPVLTHHFEELDSTSRGYMLKIEGDVEVKRDGHLGGCAEFKGGGHLVFDPQSSFAMTEGFEVGVWLLPRAGASTMTVLSGGDSYQLQLQKDPRSDGYDVLLNLQLASSAPGRRAGTKVPFQTKGGPLRAESGWRHLQVGFDGFDVSIRIDGIEHRAVRRRRGTTGDAGDGVGRRRIVIPETGAVRLTLGDGSRPYVGRMDTLVLGGVFRSSDVERGIEGLELVYPRLPVEITFRNGKLDPQVHSSDITLLFRETLNPEGPRVEFTLGRYGTVGERLVAGAGQ